MNTLRVLAAAALASSVFVQTTTAGPTPAVGPAAGGSPTQPNILIIVTDDQRDDGFLSVMPNVRRLFKRQGTRFSSALSTTPLCCPSRGSILSGRYAHNHGILTNNTFSQVIGFDHSTSMQCHLQAAGFHTAIAGKFFNIWPLGQAPPCFQHWAILNEGYTDPELNVDGVRAPVIGYSTDLIGDFAGDNLEAFEADDEAPWFMYVAPYAPHYPFTAAPSYAQTKVARRKANPAVSEADRSDKPPVVQDWNLRPAKWNWLRRVQFRTLMSVDDMVGDLFERLQALGEDERTLAVFLSDNGLLWAEHGIHGTKRYPYLPSVQVPLFLRWPGHVAEGRVDRRLVGNIDIAPTVFQAVGLPLPSGPPMDGASLLDPSSPRSRLLLEYFRSPDDPAVPSWAGTITDTYEFVEWYADDGTTITFREYYDLVADPWQLKNLLGDRKRANDPDVATLHARLSDDRSCAGASCPH